MAGGPVPTPHLQIPLSSPRNFNSNLDVLSPVTQYGSFEFDRIIKAGDVSKRTRKTKSWKPIYIVLRPNRLSIYRDRSESKLRHQIALSELTAIARQKDAKRKEKHIFCLYSPSRNYHLEAPSDREAQEWVALIRREARLDDEEEDMSLASPGGTHSSWQGFERSIDAHVHSGGYSSSDAEALAHPPPLPRHRERGASNLSTHNNRRTSHVVDYSGAEHASFSDFSDSVGNPAAGLSTLSLSHTDGRPSTSSNQPNLSHSVYSSSVPTRPSMGARNLSQMSGLALNTDENRKAASSGAGAATADTERVVYHGWIFLLKSKSGVRQWKKVWMVLRLKGLAIYKNGEEYSALLILPFSSLIDVVEIDPISKSKTSCMQIITEERNYRFCALDEESLARWLGAFKSMLAKRKAQTTASVAA